MLSATATAPCCSLRTPVKIRNRSKAAATLFPDPDLLSVLASLPVCAPIPHLLPFWGAVSQHQAPLLALHLMVAM